MNQYEDGVDIDAEMNDDQATLLEFERDIAAYDLEHGLPVTYPRRHNAEHNCWEFWSYALHKWVTIPESEDS